MPDDAAWGWYFVVKVPPFATGAGECPGRSTPVGVFVRTREVPVGDARYTYRPHLAESCRASCNLFRNFQINFQNAPAAYARGLF